MKYYTKKYHNYIYSYYHDYIKDSTNYGQVEISDVDELYSIIGYEETVNSAFLGYYNNKSSYLENCANKFNKNFESWQVITNLKSKEEERILFDKRLEDKALKIKDTIISYQSIFKKCNAKMLQDEDIKLLALNILTYDAYVFFRKTRGFLFLQIKNDVLGFLDGYETYKESLKGKSTKINSFYKVIGHDADIIIDSYSFNDKDLILKLLNDDTNETITITLKNCQTKNEIDLSGYSIDENTIQILNFADIKYCFRLEVFKYKEEDKYDYYDDMYIGKDINTIDSRKIEFSCCDFELAITDTNKILAEYDKYANEHLLSKNNTFDKFVVNYFWLNSIDDYGVLDNNLTFYSENVTDKTSTVCFKNYNIRFFLTGKEIQEQEFISSLNILLDKYNQENNTNYQLKKSILGHCFSNVIYKKEANKETIKFYFSGDHEFLIECDDIIFN